MARQAQGRNVRRRGRHWTVEDKDPSGFLTLSGGEAVDLTRGDCNGSLFGAAVVNGAEDVCDGVRGVRGAVARRAARRARRRGAGS